MIRNCDQCGKEYKFPPSRIKLSRFCSRECSMKGQGRKGFNLDKKEIRICEICGKEFSCYKSNKAKRLCSMTCRAVDRNKRYKYPEGKDSPFWQGGLTPIAKKNRRGKNYFKWRQAVLLRDGFKCVVCGFMGEHLNTHHIKGLKDFPELKCEVSNGVTLCESCHRKIHYRQSEV